MQWVLGTCFALQRCAKLQRLFSSPNSTSHALIQSNIHLPNHFDGTSTSQYNTSADKIVTIRVAMNDTPAAAG